MRPQNELVFWAKRTGPRRGGPRGHRPYALSGFTLRVPPLGDKHRLRLLQITLLNVDADLRLCRPTCGKALPFRGTTKMITPPAPAGRLSLPAGAEKEAGYGMGRKTAGVPQVRAAKPHPDPTWSAHWDSPEAPPRPSAEPHVIDGSGASRLALSLLTLRAYSAEVSLHPEGARNGDSSI